MTKNKLTFAAEVNALIGRNIADRSERIAAINTLTSEYDHTDMDGVQLERLTDYILREELTDMHCAKSSNVEYPFLSERQLTTRRNGEVGTKVAEDYGTDGRNYTIPKRRKRNSYENQFVDTRAKLRNKDRAIQYRKDTSPGEVIPYNLFETGGELTPEFTQKIGIGQRWRATLSV